MNYMRGLELQWLATVFTYVNLIEGYMVLTERLTSQQC